MGLCRGGFSQFLGFYVASWKVSDLTFFGGLGMARHILPVGKTRLCVSHIFYIMFLFSCLFREDFQFDYRNIFNWVETTD